MAKGIGWLTTQNFTLLGIPGKFQVNNTTGNIRYLDLDDKLLFESDGNSYDLKRAYYDRIRQYNNKLPGAVRSGVLTDEEIRKDFFLTTYKEVNVVRKNALNDPNNYPTYEVYENNARAFATIGIAGVIDPLSRISTSISSTQTGTNTPRPAHPTTVVSSAPKRNTGVDIDPQNPIASLLTEPGLVKLTEFDPYSTPSGQSGSYTDFYYNQLAGGEIQFAPQPKPKPGAPVPILRYPKADLSVGKEYGITYDYIKIRCVDYIASLGKEEFTKLAVGNNNIDETAENIQRFINQNRITEVYLRNQKTIGYVVLPMQPNLSTQNSTGWGEDSANILQLVGASLANNFLSDTNTIFNKDNIMNHLRTLYQAGKGIANEAIANKQEVAALLAGYVTGTNILQRTTGTVINPNMEMLFNGPKLRSFNFTFDMAPRFREEANEIRKMIRFFKKYMAPEKNAAGSFLKAPKIFLLEYVYNGDLSREELEFVEFDADGLPKDNPKMHPFLNKFKPCALTNFSVNYTPAGSYMTYRDGGSMTQYQLSFTFSEIEPIYQNDFDGDDTNPPNAGY